MIGIDLRGSKMDENVHLKGYPSMGYIKLEKGTIFPKNTFKSTENINSDPKNTLSNPLKHHQEVPISTPAFFNRFHQNFSKKIPHNAFIMTYLTH